MALIDTLAKRQAIQRALIAAGYNCGPDGADGDLGPNTSTAIIKFRAARGLTNPPHEAVVDTDLMRELGLLAIQNPVVEAVGTFTINLILNQFLKGTGITMDFSRIAKAIAAAISGAGIGGGASAYTYISLPPDALAALPHWVAVGVPLVNMAIGGIVAFVIVYRAPANSPA